MMRPGEVLARPRRDETLYSAIARASRYLGSPRPRLLHEAVFGIDLPVFDDLPIGLGRVAASGVLGPTDAGEAMREWTLFQYHAHYAEPGLARAVARAMAGDDGRSEVLLRIRSSALTPARLRFCVRCCGEMLGRHGDMWWRRVHQVPSVVVCPDHGAPLRQSRIERAERRRRYVAASPDVCPPDAPAVIDSPDPWSSAMLIDLARQSESVLNDVGEAHPDDRREAYLTGLDEVGLLNRVGEANLPGIARAMERHWDEALCLWPRLSRDGRCDQGWLATLLVGEHGGAPLHHLLLEGLLAALARRR